MSVISKLKNVFSNNIVPEPLRASECSTDQWCRFTANQAASQALLAELNGITDTQQVKDSGDIFEQLYNGEMGVNEARRTLKMQ